MTAVFIPNLAAISDVERKMDEALQATVLEMVNDIQAITPRDLDRLPNPINRKDGQKPNRKGGVVNIGGNYYTQITGSLKRSIGFQRLQPLSYKVGSAQGVTNPKTGERSETYGMALEFGTKYMKPRSFIRKGLNDNLEKTKSFFYSQLKKRLA